MKMQKLLFITVFHLAILCVDAKWKLAVQWRATLCQAPIKPSCQQPILEKFTIHGLWDNKPCKTVGNPLSPQEIQQLTSNLKLSEVWPDRANTTTDNENFWQHEWLKHGHCKRLGSLLYFQTAVNVYNKFPILSYLQAEGINPGSKFRVQDIHEAIFKQGGFRPQVVCGGNKLQELRICFDTPAFKGFTAVNCTTSSTPSPPSPPRPPSPPSPPPPPKCEEEEQKMITLPKA
ncbi:Ribonuclease T2-like [Dillenia turbinata]|uniref:Ribonuclease T2-like n=1 Tax=Dillenia turbinata TaxID=194707 RepID=A0AAN8V7W8_9MAGN